MKNLLFAALVIRVIVIGAMWVISSGQSLDAGTDTQGTAYDEASEHASGTTIDVLGMLSYAASIVGAAMIVGAIFFLWRAV